MIIFLQFIIFLIYRVCTGRGHVRGSPGPLDGESGALVINDCGEIIGISVGGCNLLDWPEGITIENALDKLTLSSRLGSHRLIVPIDVVAVFMVCLSLIILRNKLYFSMKTIQSRKKWSQKNKYMFSDNALFAI